VDSTGRLVLKRQDKERRGLGIKTSPPAPPYFSPNMRPPSLRGLNCFCELANCGGFKHGSSWIDLNDKRTERSGLSVRGQRRRLQQNMRP